jgi:protein TonB
MPGSRAVALPLSLAAHAIGVSALATLSVLSAPLPPLSRAPIPDAWPMPPLMPVVSVPRRGDGRPARAAAAATQRPRIAPPPVIESPAVAEEVDPRADVEPGADLVTCLGCALGPETPGGGEGAGAGSPNGTGAGTSPLRVGGLIREPVKIHHVAPLYPEIARAARVQGLVVLECLLTPEGRVENVQVISGAPLLAPAAARAVQQWRYRPTLLNGVAVPVVLTVTVHFTLR